EEEKEETNTGKKRLGEKKEEDERITISEIWDSLTFTQVIRGLLITQSFFRKNIVLPSLIIAKNIGCMLLF
ncbi:hypothetical protein B296_00023972, partial [Ensete ventricosum]